MLNGKKGAVVLPVPSRFDPLPDRRDHWRLFLLVSLLLSLLWCARPSWIAGHPFGDLRNGTYTDHFSHMNSARLFVRVGSQIWKRPIRDLLPRLSEAERQQLPADLHTAKPDFFRVPGWRSDKPIVVSWSQNPRNYPPGNFALVAPIAFAYHFTDLSASAANRLLIAYFLALAHVAFYFVFRQLFSRGTALPDVVAAVVLYGYGMFWALQGFYDLAAAIPLVLCAQHLARARVAPALLCFALAFFLHFRALFLAPWAMYATWLLIRDGQLRPRVAAAPWTFAAAAALMLAALYPFFLLQSAFARLEANTPLQPNSPAFAAGILVAFVTLVAGCAVALVRARAWLDLAILAGMSALIVTLRQAYEWHPLILFSWLVSPLSQLVTARRTVQWARITYLVGVTVLVFWYHRY